MATVEDFQLLQVIPQVRAILTRAAKLGLYDAAYELWRVRRELQTYERAADIAPSYAANDLAGERTTAENGATFFWLKTLHSVAEDEDIRKALRSVHALEEEFTRLSGEVATAIKGSTVDQTARMQIVIALLRKEFPLYSDTTFRMLLWEHLVANR